MHSQAYQEYAALLTQLHQAVAAGDEPKAEAILEAMDSGAFDMRLSAEEVQAAKQLSVSLYKQHGRGVTA